MPNLNEPGNIADDIEVTTATQTVEEVQKTIDATAAVVGKQVASPAEPSDADITAAREAGLKEDVEAGLDAEVLAEIDKLEPPPAKKIETQTERRARIGRQTKKVMKEMSKRKAAEGERDGYKTQLEAANAKIRELTGGNEPEKIAAQGKTGAEPPAAGPKAATGEKFDFPTFEVWQEKHPDGDFTQYTDERTDARYAFNERKTQAIAEGKEQVTRQKQAFDTVAASEKTFIEQHADYEEVCSKVQLVGEDREIDGQKVFVPAPGTVALQRALLRLGPEKAPAMNYYLGQHPDEAEALMRAPSPEAFLEMFGETRFKALQAPTSAVAPAGGREPAKGAAAATVAAPAKPAKPIPAAPEPLAAVRGGHTTVRTAADISDDDGEDADGYIERRKAELATS